MSDVAWIADAEALGSLVEQLRGRPWIAVDTEFLSDRAYTPRLCLVQLATDDVIACVDVLQRLDFGPLWDVLRDRGVTKVFHAAENDLAVLRPTVDDVLAPVFDTQVAAALCGHGDRIGYGDLVKRMVGVELDKSLARTDWSRRPLPGKAVQYAADDVRHLRFVFRVLLDELDANGRRTWADEEFQDLTDPERYREDSAEAWRRVRGITALDARALAILQELAPWREHEARATNRPRRWVLSDEALCGIARRAPRTAADLDRVRGFEPGRHAAHRTAILKLVAHGLATAARAGPDAGRAPAPTAVAHLLRGIVESEAAAGDVPAGLLASAADLTRAAAGDRDVRLFRGWRRALLGDRVAAFLDGSLVLQVGTGGPILTPAAELPD